MTKQVSGTIMLHLADGTKRFLVHETQSIKEFAQTDVQKNSTVLASLLKFLKKSVRINTNDIRLVELINVKKDGIRFPLYVFEMRAEETSVLPEDFVWENSRSIQEILATVEFEGVPLF